MITKYVNIVSRLGISTIQSLLNQKVVNGLHNLGLEINSSSLSTALYFEKGISIFKDKKFREKIYYSIRDVKEDISITDFHWSKNNESEKFFQFINLPIDFINFNSRNKNDIIENCSTELPLHDYQKWAKYRMTSFLQDEYKKETIVHMPTGSGKTRVTMETIVDFFRTHNPKKNTVVWMAHSEELCEQAAETFSKLWELKGTGNINIVRMWGGNKIEKIPENSLNLVITSFQTTYNTIRTANTKRFQLFLKLKSLNNLLVVDEAHQSTADTYKDAIELLRNDKAKLIGLTATPGRISEEETKELSEFYSGNLITLNDDNGNELGNNALVYLQEKQIISKIERLSWIGSSLDLSNDEITNITNNYVDIPKEILTRLGNDASRNLLIIENLIEVVVKRKMQTILFAPSKESSNLIALALRIRGVKAISITSDQDGSDRESSIEAFKNGEINIICNYGVLTTGFDAPNVEAVVVARPTKSLVLYSQMIGRGIRGIKMGGTASCLVVDVKDNLESYADLNNQFVYFNEFYNV